MQKGMNKCEISKYTMQSPGFFKEMSDGPFTPYVTLPESHRKEGSKNIM